MANLVQALVTFVVPGGDDRDHDTVTSVRIVRDGLVIAGNDNVAPGMTLSDPGTYGPFPLQVFSSVDIGTYRGSTTILQVFPNGNDRWITDIIVDGAFNDGEVLRSQSGVREVSQDAPVTSFQN